jgi:drug/metabolite transporter (DMT)-like permease
MNPVYALAALTSVAFGGADFLGGLAARRASAFTVTLVSALAGLVTLAIATAFIPGTASRTDLLWGAAAGLSGGTGVALLYRALAIGPVSVAAPVISVSMLAVPLVFGLAFGERPSALALLGIALAAPALLLITGAAAERGASPASRSVLGVSLASGVLLGGFLVMVRRIAPGAGFAPLVVARLSTIALFAALIAARRGAWWPPPGARRSTLVSGLLDSLANVAYFIAVHRGSLALIGTIISLSPATTTLLARAVFGERWSRPQQAGLALAAASIVCISLG